MWEFGGWLADRPWSLGFWTFIFILFQFWFFSVGFPLFVNLIFDEFFPQLPFFSCFLNHFPISFFIYGGCNDKSHSWKSAMRSESESVWAWAYTVSTNPRSISSFGCFPTLQFIQFYLLNFLLYDVHAVIVFDSIHFFTHSRIYSLFFFVRSFVPRGNDMHSSAVHRNPDFPSLPSIEDQQDCPGVLTGVVSQSNVTRNMTW